MSLKSLIATGTKLWLDSIEPELVREEPRPRGDRGNFQPDHHRRHSRRRGTG